MTSLPGVWDTIFYVHLYPESYPLWQAHDRKAPGNHSLTIWLLTSWSFQIKPHTWLEPSFLLAAYRARTFVPTRRIQGSNIRPYWPHTWLEPSSLLAAYRARTFVPTGRIQGSNIRPYSPHTGLEHSSLLAAYRARTSFGGDRNI